MAYGIYDTITSKVIAEFVSPLSVRSNQPIFLTDAMSLKRSVFKRSAQRWEIETKLFPLTTSANDLFTNFITKNLYTSFTILMPQNLGSVANTTLATANVGVYNTVAAGSTQVQLTYNASNNGKTLSKGSFVKSSNHNKIYMVTDDVAFISTSAFSVLIIYPALRTAVNNTVTLGYKDVQMTCRYDSDTTIGMVYEDGVLMDNGTVKLIEVL